MLAWRRDNAPMITQVKFVAYPPRSSRALKFYTEQLGFAVSTDQDFDGKQRWIELRIANSATRVVLYTPEGHEDRIGTFFNGSLACDDVAATYRSCWRAALSSCRRRKTALGRIRHFQRPRRQSVRALLELTLAHVAVASSTAFLRLNPAYGAGFQQIQRQHATVQHFVVKSANIEFGAEFTARAFAQLAKT